MDRDIGFKATDFLCTQRGNAGVEFALVLPILMFLLFGSIELGRALHDYQVVNGTVRDAARYLSRVGITCASAGAGQGSLNDLDDEERAKVLAMTGHPDFGSPAPNLLGYWDYATQDSTVTVSIDCIDNTGGTFMGLYNEDVWNDFVPHVIVTANVPFTFLFGELVSSDATIDFNISHRVVVTGE